MHDFTTHLGPQGPRLGVASIGQVTLELGSLGGKAI
jgi:hypothetical protein